MYYRFKVVRRLLKDGTKKHLDHASRSCKPTKKGITHNSFDFYIDMESYYVYDASCGVQKKYKCVM
jgi:hypothetical protein